MQQLYGGIEAGGTKFVLAVAPHPTADFVDTVTIPTTTVAETIEKAIAFFRQHSLKGLGIASFGPVDLDTRSPTYGSITTTPKQGWQFTDLLGAFRTALQTPVQFDTDVNAAALAEWRYGAGHNASPVVYFTVGTGVGGGGVVEGQMLHGLTHPEGGHILVRRHPNDTFAGSCPYHGDCLEGLASGPAMAARWGQPASALPADHIAWVIEADYLAQAACTTLYLMSPQKIIFGGGVMHQPHLIGLIRERAYELLHDYIQHPAIQADRLIDLIVPPLLGDRAGSVGALELAHRAGDQA